VLVYHPLPDEQGDPWGVAAMNLGGRNVDWMAGYYAAYDFPTAAIDGVNLIAGLPTLEGAGAFQDTYNAYRRSFEARRAEATPVSMRLQATLGDDAVQVNAVVRSLGLVDDRGLVLRFVLFEDDVGFSGGNGIVNHRFVVRALSPMHPVNLGPGDFQVTGNLPLAPFVNRENVGVVAIVQNTAEDSTLFGFKEVVQSASWTVRQSGATNQVSRGVLLELYSATWCASCVYGDSATDALADEFGLQSALVSQTGFEYLRSVQPAGLVFAAAVAIGSFVLLRRQQGGAS
jgi:thiol-disulfide isomerase/thioredoxin